MIKIKRKKVLKEAEPLAGTSSTLKPLDITNEKDVDDSLKAVKLNQYANLPNTSQVNVALEKDFKQLTGDIKHGALAKFLTLAGIKPEELANTANKMKEKTV